MSSVERKTTDYELTLNRCVGVDRWPVAGGGSIRLAFVTDHPVPVPNGLIAADSAMAGSRINCGWRQTIVISSDSAQGVASRVG